MSEVLPVIHALDPVPLIDLKAQHQSLRSDVLAAVERVLDSQVCILGDEVSEFECDVAEYCDARDAIGCASGSDALLLCMQGLGIGPGDEVITSPFTFFATASAITRVGATPVFADIRPDTFNIDPEAVAARLTARTRAIIPVHLFGQCADMDPLWRLATQNQLAVVEDACQAIGAEYRGRRTGVLGTAACFSFFPTKNLGAAGDGGLVTCDDPELAARLRRLRVHGDLGGYNHQEVGINSRLDSLQAAILRVKLRYLDQWAAGRKYNARRYAELFDATGLNTHLSVPFEAPECRHVYNQYTVRVAAGRRDEVLKSLRAQQIGCNIYYPKPLHLQPCFANLGGQSGQFPESERAAAEVLSLPIYCEMTEAQQDRVVNGLCHALGLPALRQRTISLPFRQSDSRAA